LAVMAGAGTRAFGRRMVGLRVIGLGAAVAVVASLMAWNAGQEVAPSLDLSRARGAAVIAVASHVGRGAHVVTSLMLAGRLADDGFHAEGGFAALQRAVRFGHRKPGVGALVSEARRRP